MKPYPNVPQQPNLPAIEQRILEWWEQNRTFERSVSGRQAGKNDSNEYVFYDGPPFANGLPHFGHLLTGYIKDIVPRYQTLRGRRVERRFGWDCHGLPAEMEVERELKVSGRRAIQEYGIDRFNQQCRETVMQYTGEWEQYVTRQARWVDFQNDYKTMDTSYIESVIWAFKTLYERDLLYEGYRVLPYSWACETPVSNFETRLDDSYRERQDPAVTVRFELKQKRDGLPVDLLAWTTTPWTLPSNLAIAVGPQIPYGVFKLDNRIVILGEECTPKYSTELNGAEHIATILGKDLIGASYKSLFPFFEQTDDAFRVLAADWVDVNEGSGIVHMAPGFGEDDMAVCRDHGIGVVCPVDDHGAFTHDVPDWEGEQVFEANPSIIRRLRKEGKLFKHETILHNYPHCWRTDTPLIYRAVNSWYVRVTAIRERMVELNQQIKWIPHHIRDGLFGKWLDNARDWSISRNRFWGSPIPVWKSDDPKYPRIDVYGSLSEIERDFGIRPEDLHRPYIDSLVRPNPDDPEGQSVMRRIPDVLDGWFDSGAMPFAQVHYPFENREWFENHFPADFIVEYVAQTRGWFYTLMVLGTGLFDRPPFKNCICHGVTLDQDGQKLSKRLRNYPDPKEVFDVHGSDALRWYLVSSPLLKAGDLRIEQDGKSIAETVRGILHPIWNAWYFFALYANSDGIRANRINSSNNLIDQYILAKTHDLVVKLTELFDTYEIAAACHEVSIFLDTTNNWFIRRSRERFWKTEHDEDKHSAYNTLYTVLVTLCELASPLLPFLTEEIYRGLNDGESVHLGKWPEPKELPQDKQLVSSMDRVREICSASLALRRSQEIRVRQPLRRLTVAGANSNNLIAYQELIADEVNVKEVVFQTDIEEFASFRLHVNARSVGPRVGTAMKQILAAARDGEWRITDEGRIEIGGALLNKEEYQLLLEPIPGVHCLTVPSNDMVVVLDFDLDSDLISEGQARDVVRVIQQARRDEGLHVTDRIHLAIKVPDSWANSIKANLPWIADQTLAETASLIKNLDSEKGSIHESSIGNEKVQVVIQAV